MPLKYMYYHTISFTCQSYKANVPSCPQSCLARSSPNACLMLGQRHRCSYIDKHALDQCLLFGIRGEAKGTDMQTPGGGGGHQGRG